MNMTEADPDQPARDIADEESEAAAAEAAKIGGPAPDYGTEDPAERPLAEAGEGEAEGFELAEERLEDVAAHGDQHRFPGRDALPDEEAVDAEFGEADEPIPSDE